MGINQNTNIHHLNQLESENHQTEGQRRVSIAIALTFLTQREKSSYLLLVPLNLC